MSFDLYIDANPADTISIKYTTVKDVENTIKKLERLYKAKKYSHVRIGQVANILRARLRLIKGKEEHYKLADRYFQFLKTRTPLKPDDRYTLSFTI